MKAVIRLDVPDWQIGQEATVYFPDTMCKRGKCESLEPVAIKKELEDVFGLYGGTCPKYGNWIQSQHMFCGICGQEVEWNA